MITFTKDMTNNQLKDILIEAMVSKPISDELGYFQSERPISEKFVNAVLCMLHRSNNSLEAELFIITNSSKRVFKLVKEVSDLA